MKKFMLAAALSLVLAAIPAVAASDAGPFHALSKMSRDEHEVAFRSMSDPQLVSIEGGFQLSTALSGLLRRANRGTTNKVVWINKTFVQQSNVCRERVCGNQTNTRVIRQDIR